MIQDKYPWTRLGTALLATLLLALGMSAPAAGQGIEPADDEPESEVVDPGEGEDDPAGLDLEMDLDRWQRYFGEGNYRKSGRLISKLQRENPESVPVGLAAVEQSMMIGSYRKAGRLLDGLSDLAPKDHAVRAARARLMLATGEHEEAEQLLRELAEESPDDVRSRYLVAELLDKELGRREEAKQLYGTFYDWWNALSVEDAAELSAEQILFLGMACWGYEDPHVALQQMDEAAKREPGYVDALLAQGFILLEKYNKPVARREGFEPALEINANHPDAHCGIAALHLAEFGQVDAAEAALKKALRVNPNHVLALQLSARARLDSQDYEGARRYLDSALAVNPDNLMSLSLVAALACVTGDELELQRIEELISERAEPAQAVLYDTVAAALAGRHRYPEAVEYGRKAVAADARYAPAFVNLGINLTRSGEHWQEGKTILEKAYDRDSFNVQVYNFLKLLDDYGKDYDTIETEHLRIVLHKKDKEVIGYDLAAILEEAWTSLTEKYQVTPPTPITVEMLPEHQDFSVRSVGQTGLGALGVCFGRVVTLLGPEGMKQVDPNTREEKIHRFNWGQTAWHEFAHVITLTKTNGRIPRWFTEGLSVFEEKERRREWSRELEIPVNDALENGSLRGIVDLNEGFTRGDEIMLSYFVGSLVCEFIRDEFGFDHILQMLDLYARDMTTDRVIEEVFEFDAAKFDDRFKEYLRQSFAEYEMTPRFNKSSIIRIRDALDRGPTGVEEIVLNSRLALASWDNRNTADAEIYAVKAINLREALIESSGDSDEARAAAASAYIVLARHFHQRDRTEKAKEYFEKAFELGSDDFFAHKMRAQIAEGEQDLERAIEEYEAAIEALPRYASPPDSPYRALYRLYREEGEEEKAIAILEAFCRVDDSDLEIRRLLAHHYKDTGQDEKMLEILTQARLITCSDAEINTMLAGVGATGLDTATRLRQVRASLAVPGLEDATRVRLLIDLGEIHLELGELMEALDAVEDALVIDAESFRAEKVMKDIEARIAREPGMAREVEKRRLTSKADDPGVDSSVRGEAMVALARIAIEEDDLYEARDLLERATELPVVVEGAHELLDEVEKRLTEEERGEDE